MKVIVPTVGELIWRQCEKMLMLNPLAHQTYYSTLFNMFRGLLAEEHVQELNAMVKEIEDWMSDDFNNMTLQEMEILMFQNLDWNSGFEVNGVFITQKEINTRLEKIKDYLQQQLYVYIEYIRFTQQLSVE